MKWTHSSTIFSLVCVMLLGGCRTQKEETKIVRVATAANMQFAMEQLTTAFTKNTGISCEVVVSSSGKLYAQIREGAPYDLFVSADLKYPNELHKKKLTRSAPKVYAYGQLVLWTMNDTLQLSLDQLTLNQIRHIAIANPKTAPYGRAAIEVLKRHTLVASVSEKLVYGESIAQTNQFITSGAAEIGFTSKSVVVSNEMKGKGKWVVINNNDYSPIKQGVVLLNNRKIKNPVAQKFYDFLFTEEGKNILQNFGYSVYE
ncbi:MAG: molybdate ABC transporter substrate-binding protein [Eudoraea sp.]|nr:molybdate ABC transporter substrate-binding protein [Eudoraea sp.]